MPARLLVPDTTLSFVQEPVVALEQVRQTLRLLGAVYPRPSDKARFATIEASVNELLTDLYAELPGLKDHVIALTHVMTPEGTRTFTMSTDADEYVASVDKAIAQQVLISDAQSRLIR